MDTLTEGYKRTQWEFEAPPTRYTVDFNAHLWEIFVHGKKVGIVYPVLRDNLTLVYEILAGGRGAEKYVTKRTPHEVREYIKEKFLK